MKSAAATTTRCVCQVEQRKTLHCGSKFPGASHGISPVALLTPQREEVARAGRGGEIGVLRSEAVQMLDVGGLPVLTAIGAALCKIFS